MSTKITNAIQVFTLSYVKVYLFMVNAEQKEK